MGLNEALAERRAAVLDRWFKTVLSSYPEETARFLAGVADPFANPVGGTIREGLARVLDTLAAPCGPRELETALDGIVRIRAVQEFAPSAAVAFVFELRGILREELPGAGAGAADLRAMEAAVDRLALAAFDVYTRCREKIFEIRVREIRESLPVARPRGVAAGVCASQTRGEGE